MIIGIGIDSIEIDRFKEWHTYSDAQLLRIFSQEEIDYCRANPIKSAERFAVRFAAREALFKALPQPISFLRLCKAVSIKKDPHGKPIIFLNEKLINLENCKAWLSLTHTKTIATAMVILES